MANLQAYLQPLRSLAAQPAATMLPATLYLVTTSATPPVDFARFGSISRRPMPGLRKIISQRMAENWNTIPHVTQFDEIDITRVMELRKTYAAAYEKKGAKLTVTTFVLKALTLTLRQQRILYIHRDEAAQTIVIHHHIHPRCAMDTTQRQPFPVISHR